MQIETSGNLTPALTQHVQDRLVAALDQHASRVDQVVVKLRDDNGPRGGARDQRCQVTVRLRPRGLVIVREVGADMYAVISHAADRVKQAVGRLLRRKRAAAGGPALIRSRQRSAARRTSADAGE